MRYIAAILMVFMSCTPIPRYDDTEIPDQPLVKTMVRFSGRNLEVALCDPYIKVLKIDTSPGTLDTGFYIDYIELDKKEVIKNWND